MPEAIRVHALARWCGIGPVPAIALLATYSSSPAGADILPNLNASAVFSSSTVQTMGGPLTDTKVDIAPPNPTGPWAGSAFSNASDAPNSAFGLMTMSFSASQAGLRVTTGGASNVINEGINRGAAELNYFFEVGYVVEAEFVVSLVQHTLSGSAGVTLYPFSLQNVPYRLLGVNWGTTTTSVRLAPGTYLVSGYARYDSTALSGTPPTFSLDAAFPGVPIPLVNTQPTPQTRPVGSTASFSVGTSSAATGPLEANAPTFQWRRNLANLVDGGTVSGATTNHLVISSVAYADSGFYDVVVTLGSIEEPSSLAQLTVVPSTTDVDPELAVNGVELDLPQPNPAYGRTRVRLSLPAAMPAGLDVLDVSGRVVKTLLPYGRYEAGARTAEWDGSELGGRRAAPGVYFLRLHAGKQQEVRRVVNLASN